MVEHALEASRQQAAGSGVGEHAVDKHRKEKSRMKVRSSLKSLKNQPGSQVVRRRGRVYVLNKQNPRFKARQG